MYSLENLAQGKTYLLSGHTGEWHFSRRTGTRITFYQFIDTNRRTTAKLTPYEVEQGCWEKIETINLSRLEAFNGQ